MTNPEQQQPQATILEKLESVLKGVPASDQFVHMVSRSFVEETAERLRELEHLFDLQWKSDMRAIKLWQEAHPGNDLVWPDKTKNTLWLLEQIESLQQQLERKTSVIENYRLECTKLHKRVADGLNALLQQAKTKGTTDLVPGAAYEAVCNEAEALQQQLAQVTEERDAAASMLTAFVGACVCDFDKEAESKDGKTHQRRECKYHGDIREERDTLKTENTRLTELVKQLQEEQA